ncbi:hypothetical protein H3Z85_00945 [Chryseobacterium indologenes]|uniref:Uncharacterized protein n=3 Tax=Chryseobacterium TaxID=59732 RepID=A0A3G6RP44_CHRLC|nr:MULTISPECIES: hypothetical protein [Bacteroidota]AZA84601.1 hypothetical protein EG342_23085 [Chryseobacterium lactis]AZB04989.1 hypothetical protein EG341_13965 [Chryseobacterium lactis]KMQ64461.1 hypothetical protein ACM46_09305 [Chryseobacterium angstadtii]MBF6643594.1 hypothetical protein [Chryseobacterium indologenes]PNW14720.1 hypothetical protein C1637_07115 [Chryseobacterium lactis]
MNGIIFQHNKAHIGCSAKFMFIPEPGQRSIPAIAEFQGGEKAYAVIEEVNALEVVLRIGEYLDAKGLKVPEKVWRMRYDKDNDQWQIVGSFLSNENLKNNRRKKSKIGKI